MDGVCLVKWLSRVGGTTFDHIIGSGVHIIIMDPMIVSSYFGCQFVFH